MKQLLLFITACWTLCGWAQHVTLPFVGVSIQAHSGLATFKDQLVSSLRYTGFTVGAQTRYLRTTSKSNLQIRFGYATGTLRNSIDAFYRNDIPRFHRFNFIGNYSREWKELGKWNFLPGAMIQSSVVTRTNQAFDNAAFVLDAFAVIGPTFRVERNWTKKERTRTLWFLKWQQQPHKMQLSAAVDCGLGGVGFRPEYQTISNITFNNSLRERYFQQDNRFWGLANRIMTINTEVAISWTFLNGNALAVRYQWQYYQLNNTAQRSENRVQGALNTIGVSLITRLNKKE